MNNFSNIDELESFLASDSQDNQSTTLLQPPQEEGKAPTSEEPKKENTEKIRTLTTSEILSSMQIKVDLSKVNIVRTDNPLTSFQELERLFSKSSFDVIALKSGYRASFSAMNNQDMIRVRKISGTIKEQNVKLMRIIYDHMVSNSIGKISFPDWLRVTAEADYETLIYGIYCATFPNDVDYSVNCPNCKHKNTLKIGKDHLVQVIDDTLYNYVDTVINERKTVQELIRESELNNTTRIILPESKIIIDISLASIEDLINSLKNAEVNTGYEKEIFGYLKHFSAIMVPIVRTFIDGNPQWLEITSVQEKANVIANIPFSDRTYLETCITEKTNKNTVSYRLPDCKCGACGEPIKNINVDMTEVLFQNIAKG